jgi:DNA-binding MarR family transcriptional regulator
MAHRLHADAEALYDAATRFIRLYQFRDREQALRFGLTVAQAYALDLLISSDGDTLTGLAARLRLDKSTTSRIVSGMEEAGLIAFTRPDHDRRAKQLVASTEGRKRYRRLRHAIVRANAALLKTYRPRERSAVIRALNELADRGTK